MLLNDVRRVKNPIM